MKMLLLALVLGVSTVARADDWVVIAAGSRTYGNYRHQADACHAYQIAIKGGTDPDKIILIAYDDIANNPSNPFPGKIFNKPTAAGTPGVDVYQGCKIDYKGQQATAATFLKVLTGDASAGGKVLKSTSKDRVFINFADHGGVGIVAFPVGPYLKVADLNDALKTMHTKNMYQKLVFYMEACESGSMFEGVLPENINIYATTAANAKESSWGTYCPPQDSVDGKELRSCLGDLYSVTWMEDTDTNGYNQSIGTQFDTVKRLTTKSHVMEYGDTSIKSDQVGQYLGNPTGVAPEAVVEAKPTAAGAVSSRDIPLHLAYYNYVRADKRDPAAMRAEAEALQKIIAERLAADDLFLKLTSLVAGENGATLMGADASTAATVACDACCGAVHDAVQQYCGGYTDYSFQYARVVVNVCEEIEQNADMTAKLVDTIRQSC
jgi:legumain